MTVNDLPVGRDVDETLRLVQVGEVIIHCVRGSVRFTIDVNLETYEIIMKQHLYKKIAYLFEKLFSLNRYVVFPY